MRNQNFVTPIMMLLLCACTPSIVHLTTATVGATPVLPKTTSPTTTSALTITPPILPPEIISVLPSPDGTKKIQSTDWKHFEVLNSSGALLWSLSYDVNKFGADEAPLLQYAGYSPLAWSPDGNYIYLTCHHGGEMDSSTKYYGNTFIDGDGVFRFDVATGEMQEVLPELLSGYYAFSLSPDGNQLVYADQAETPVKIVLLKLDTERKQILFTAKISVLEIGGFGWSPKMDKLVFSTFQMQGDQKGQNDSYNIFLLDLKSLEVQTIIKNFHQYLAFDSWDGTGRINYYDTFNKGWQMYLETKVLSAIVAPTPTP